MIPPPLSHTHTLSLSLSPSLPKQFPYFTITARALHNTHLYRPTQTFQNPAKMKNTESAADKIKNEEKLLVPKHFQLLEKS